VKKLLTILFIILACLLLCSVISASVFAFNPFQHIDGEDFGLISLGFAMATVCLVSAVLKAHRLNHDAVNKQRILSLFYCGWQNSSYVYANRACDGSTIT
jgi:hypothetical protein